MPPANPLATTPTVRFGRRPDRGLLLGFSAPRVTCLGAAFAGLTLALFTGGATRFLQSLPLWLLCLVLAFATWQGRPIVETLPTLGHFAARHLLGQNRFRARPSTTRPAGTLALPGDAAALRVHVDEQTGTAIIHDPHAGTATVVAEVKHPAYVLLSPDEQARRVSGWGRALSGLSASGACARVQVLELALPDSGLGIRGWWQANGKHDTGQWACGQYAELMRAFAPAASTHRTLVALALDLRRVSRRLARPDQRVAAAAAGVRQEMAGFEAAMRAAEVNVSRWLDESDLAAMLRSAYDPQLNPVEVGPRRLGTAGPVAIDEHWDHLRHDTGCSAVLWISEWPRVSVPAHFLHALVFQQGIRKTISITATPLSPAQAMREVRKAKVEYLTDAAQKARIGAIADQSDAAEYADVLDRESAIVAGHADLRFTGLITVTAPEVDELKAAVAQIERAASQCGCETRRLYGQQARAFTAAALPLARKVG